MCSLYFWLFLTIIVYDLYSLVHYFFWHFYNIGILFVYLPIQKKSKEEKTLFSIKKRCMKDSYGTMKEKLMVQRLSQEA